MQGIFALEVQQGLYSISLFCLKGNYVGLICAKDTQCALNYMQISRTVRMQKITVLNLPITPAS